MNKVNRIITRGDLFATPIPDETRTYKPYTHQQLDQMTLEGLDKAGFALKNDHFFAAKLGQQAIGRYDINFGGDPDMGMMIAWQNSYDKTISLKYAVGAHVFVCSNGSVHGDVGAYKRKHTGDIQVVTPQIIEEYLNKAAETFLVMIKDKERMKEIDLTKRTCAELIGAMYIDEGLITATQMNIINGEIHNPSFDYGAENSLWQLYNHTTHAIKNDHPRTWIQRHMDVNSFFKKEFNLETVTA